MRLGEGSAPLLVYWLPPPFFFLLPSPSCSNSPAHKYYLATNPVSGVVYLSDTSSRKVFKVKSLRVVKDVAKNLELVAGTGDQCLPYDDARCGDGGKAVEATLTNPRGIFCGFDYNNVLYCSLMEEELKMCRKRSNRSLGILCGFMIAQLSLHEFKWI